MAASTNSRPCLTADLQRDRPVGQRPRVLARKDEFEDALVDLRRRDALERQAIETALATVYALMTGDIAHPSDRAATASVPKRARRWTRSDGCAPTASSRSPDAMPT